MPSNIQAAKLLGWASLAIGATEIVATRFLEETIGVEDRGPLLRAFGVREIAAGVTILNQPGLNGMLAGGLWARVVGDAMDLAALGVAGESTKNKTGWSAVTAMVLGVTAIDVVVACRVQRQLHQAKTISAAAKSRVTPTAALPVGAVAVNRTVELAATP